MQIDSEIETARKILGKTVAHLPDGELKKVINQFDHLTDLWMEDYERSIFDGKTLNDIVRT
ncbi:hypothetical protein HYW46_03110 [Candidatus Daviesbacteria bacterium]|nr:hypothetical protein [Candidatus Daviesbacteria bacterium]